MINYRHIADAIEYYEKAGYRLLDVPWLVSAESSGITKPAGVRDFQTFAGCLVASGEQSFLHIRESLGPGRYQCCTPCFRDEKELNDLHRQYFIKVELIDVNPQNPERSMGLMMADVVGFIQESVHLGGWAVKEVPTSEGRDIVIHDVEVGSYGIRQHGDFLWVYGTGLAEPRFSQAVSGQF